jgi:hypothetical protein
VTIFDELFNDRFRVKFIAYGIGAIGKIFLDNLERRSEEIDDVYSSIDTSYLDSNYDTTNIFDCDLEDLDCALIICGVNELVKDNIINLLNKCRQNNLLTLVAYINSSDGEDDLLDDIIANCDSLLYISRLNNKDDIKVEDYLFEYIKALTTSANQNRAINADYVDMRALLGKSGLSYFGVGQASGNNSLIKAMGLAILNQFNDLPVFGVNSFILQISYSEGYDYTLAEVNEAIEVLRKYNKDASIIFSIGVDEMLAKDTAKIYLIGCDSK